MLSSTSCEHPPTHPTYLNYHNLTVPLAQGPCTDYFLCLDILLVALLGIYLVSLSVFREAIPDPSSNNHMCELVLSLVECLLTMQESLISIPRPRVDHINCVCWCIPVSQISKVILRVCSRLAWDKQALVSKTNKQTKQCVYYFLKPMHLLYCFWGPTPGIIL